MSSDKQVERALANAAGHHQAGRLANAEALYRQVLAEHPFHPAALHMLGLIAHQTGHHLAALEQITLALRQTPHDPAMHLNLGEVFRALRRREEAAAEYERALALKPDYAEAHHNLGLLREKQGQPVAALTHFEQVKALQPNSAEAYDNLGRVLKALGQIDAACAHYREAIRRRPGDAALHSHLVFALQFDPALDQSAIREEHLNWNSRHALPLRSTHRPFVNDPSPDRRLRIGYVSADLYQHPISFFLYPLLRAHDPRQVEVYVYSGVKNADVVTGGMRKLVSVWREAAALSDADLAAQIRADGIDILVDLGMHASNSRLLVFARRPAPLQISWLAYPGTTGLDAIDYRLSDRHMDPPEETDASPTLGGQPWRLPDSWCCYHPLGDTPAVNGLPALRPESGGIVTFGSLNNFNKVNGAVLRRWGRVLAAVPNSRLLLCVPPGKSVGRRVRAGLAAGGEIADGRVEFLPSQGRSAYFQTYGRLDIGLDPFPFNGMTTTCDALWMGVPVLTLPGSTSGSRVGGSLLSSVGLEALVAKTEDDYVSIAQRLASELPRLAHIRATLRARMESSPLMDAPRFAHHVEQAYRQIWRRWCER